MFEVLTWSQLGFHTKPCGLLNIENYYDSLVNFLNHAIDEGFVKGHHRDMLIHARQASTLLDQMAEYTKPIVDKWGDNH